MDAIALLCTLHADGPTTARRLRRSGCSTLSALLALEPERLATILDGPPAVARRFLREAKSLNERLGGAWNERGEDGESRLVVAEGAPADAVPADIHLQGREQRILDEVLASWRRKDADEMSTTSSAPSTNGRHATETADAADATSARAEPSDARDGTDVAKPLGVPGALGTNGRHANGRHARAAVSAEAARVAPAPDRLRAGAVDGLDADACARLAAAGVSSLDDLARLDALAVASGTGLGYTRLARWRGLAERARRTQHEVDGASHPERSQLADPPAAERRVAPATRRPVQRFSPQETPAGPAASIDLLVGLGAREARADSDDPAGPFA